MIKLFSIPLSAIYGMVTSIRNTLYDWKIKKSVEYDIPVVCVGNLSVGGTGKTPHTELVVSLLKQYYNVAVLSRGYKRRTKGYVVVKSNSKCRDVGDEPKQIKLKYLDTPVVVCENRRIGIARLRKDFPDTNLVILDDGYQHRHVETWLNILLTEHDKPFYEDRLLPWGRLRESKSGMSRAQIVVITKTPTDIKPIDLRLITKKLNLFPYQALFFTYMEQKPPVAIFEQDGDSMPREKSDIIAISGLASNNGFVEQLKTKYNVVDTLGFKDHHSFTMKDVKVMKSLLAKHPDAHIFVTEKDGVKFMNSKKLPLIIRQKLFMVPIKVKFLNTDLSRKNSKNYFLEALLPYVRKNHKYNNISI